MAGERRFTRIPPESSGDRIKMKHTVVIPFDQKDQNHNWIIGGIYTIDGNFGNTFSVEILGYDQGGDLYQGVLYARYDSNNEYINNDAEDDQNIKNPDGNIVAYVNGTPYATYINTTHIVGDNNPEYAANVDRFGGLYTRFTEGAPEVSAWGKIRQIEPKLIASWDFSKQFYPDQFANSIEGTGTVDWDADIGAVKLGVTNIGDRTTNTTNLFAPVPPGTGVLYLMAARASDNTIGDGYVRFWGAFDLTDGFYFALISGALSVRHRYSLETSQYPYSGNSPAGAVDHTVLQSDWNKDTLDGTGGVSNPSGMKLDVTKINTYWIDYQWLGGGRVRYGVFYQGERVVCHELYIENGQMNQNGAAAVHNSISNPSRPMCWAMAHPAGTAGEKNFYAYGGAMYLESDVSPLEHSPLQSYKNNSYILDGDSTSTTYAFTLRPQLNLSIFDNPAYGAGLEDDLKENHSIYSPKELQISGRPTDLSVTSATVATNTLTVNTERKHYLTVDDKFELWGTSTVDGRYRVATVVSPFEVTATTAGISDTTGETGELRVDRDNFSDSREIEVRVFAKCIMKGVSFSNVSFTNVEADIYGNHLAHGPEMIRFVTNDSQQNFDFGKFFNNIQYGAVYNGSDRGIARRYQTLGSIIGNDDKYSTGVQRVRLVIAANSHPIYGTTIHYFDDKNKFVFRDPTGTQNLTGFSNNDFDGLKTVDGDWHYLALIDRDEAWVYNSEADIDDDRSVRVLQLDADPTGTIAVGDTVTLDTGGHTAIAKTIYVSGTNYYLGVEARSSAAFDGYTGTINSTAFTVSGVTKSSDRIGVWSGWDEGAERITFDLDYKTSLLAVDSSGWDNQPAQTITDANRIYGIPPTQPAWTFMVRHLEKHRTDTNVRWAMYWKVRTQ